MLHYQFACVFSCQNTFPYISSESDLSSMAIAPLLRPQQICHHIYSTIPNKHGRELLMEICPMWNQEQKQPSTRICVIIAAILSGNSAELVNTRQVSFSHLGSLPESFHVPPPGTMHPLPNYTQGWYNLCAYNTQVRPSNAEYTLTTKYWHLLRSIDQFSCGSQGHSSSQCPVPKHLSGCNLHTNVAFNSLLSIRCLPVSFNLTQSFLTHFQQKGCHFLLTLGRWKLMPFNCFLHGERQTCSVNNRHWTAFLCLPLLPQLA